MINVEIHLKRGTLTIKPSPDEQLHVESQPPLVAELIGGTAVIDGKSIPGQVDATVLVPATSGSLHASIGVGPCTISSVAVKDARLNLGLGPLIVEDSQGKWDANLGKGDATFTRVDGPLNINMGMGRLRLRQIRGPADINNGLGSIEIHESDGDYKIKAGKGDVLWQSTQGSGTIHAGMGTVEVVDSRGARLEIKSGLGKTSVVNSNWEAVQVDTGVGDIRIEGSVASLFASAKQRGHIHVSLADPLDTRIEASTERGRIISSFNLMPVGHAGPQRGERVVGIVGDGQREIRLYTRRGNITLDAASDPKTSVPDETDERLAILRELKNGTITVDEAEDLLSALETNFPGSTSHREEEPPTIVQG